MEYSIWLRESFRNQESGIRNQESGIRSAGIEVGVPRVESSRGVPQDGAELPFDQLGRRQGIRRRDEDVHGSMMLSKWAGLENSGFTKHVVALSEYGRLEVDRRGVRA